MINLEDKERESLIWGAMLHDIGKFKQRAEQPMDGVHHQEIGGLAVEEFVPKDILPKVKILVAEHHSKNTQDPLIKIAQIADHLSATEREEIKKESKEQYYEKGKTLEASLLENPLSNLKFEGEQNEPVHFPLLPLESKNILNQPEPWEKGRREDYKKLWAGFLEEAKSIHEVEASSRLSFSILYYLLEKYTWCIPSATIKSGNVPDISLFDHCKLSTALAVCLYDAGLASDMGRLKEIEEAVEQNKKEQKEVFALIAGDISGIQKFIFRTGQGTKGGVSAKRLRGRSFMLKLIADAVVSRIMQELSLPEPCLLFCAGGRFTILAPNIEKVKQVVDKAIKDANAALIKKYGGVLTVNIAVVPIKAMEIREFQNVLSEKVAFALEDAKNKKAQLIFSDSNIRKEIEKDGENCGKCPICSLPMKELKEYVVYGERTEMCKNCFDETLLGEKISHLRSNSKTKQPTRWAKYWEIYSAEVEGAIAPLEGFNFSVWFAENDEAPHTNARKTCILINENPSISQKKVWEGADSLRFETAGIYWWQETGSEVATYEDMAKQNKVGYLGWLKMDVDDLGSIFRGRMEPTKTLSLSRYCFLSRVLEYFFKAGINEIMKECKSVDEGKPLGSFVGQIIYAGGDDVFIVGSWDQIIPLAIKISQKFDEYSGYSGISLSAGIAITPAKYPIGAAVEEAEKNLEKAKKIRRDERHKHKKRAIAIFGDTLQFAKKDGSVQDSIEKLLEDIKTLQANLPKQEADEKNTGLLRQLLQIKKQCPIKKKIGSNVFFSYKHVPRILYLLARHYKKDDENEKMEKMKQLLLDERFYSHLELAISIPVLLMRKKGD